METRDSVNPKLLLIGIPLEWQDDMMASLVNEQFMTTFSASKDDAIKFIRTGDLSAVIITSDLVFDNDVSQDIVALTYGKIPTLTIILRETIEKYGQGKVFGKVYNTKAFQEFCTAPLSMEELIPRLRKIIEKAKNASSQQ